MSPASDDGKLLEVIRKLQDDVQALRKSGYIPRLAADPAVASGITLWMLHDGRLRGRLASGAVQEWSRVEHSHPGISGSVAGGSTSTVAAPAAPYVPSQQLYEENADWTQAYWHSGAERYPNAQSRLYYGQEVASTGETMSMIHFPNLSFLNPGPAGSRIVEVWLRLSNLHTYSAAGGDLYLGVHNTAVLPGTFQQTLRPPLKIRVGNPSIDEWYQLPQWVGEYFRDDLASGFTLYQASTDPGLAGYAAGVGHLNTQPPRLKIIHVK